jgi:hypothetical protein
LQGFQPALKEALVGQHADSGRPGGGVLFGRSQHIQVRGQ